jgi:hypothetical protein
MLHLALTTLSTEPSNEGLGISFPPRGSSASLTVVRVKSRSYYRLQQRTSHILTNGVSKNAGKTKTRTRVMAKFHTPKEVTRPVVPVKCTLHLM